MQMKIVFDSFQKVSSYLSEEDCRLYAYEILLPLYKVCEGFSGRVIHGEFFVSCYFPMPSFVAYK